MSFAHETVEPAPDQLARLAILALGSNLGDRQANLAQAVERIAASSGVVRVETSPIASTDPVGGPAQPEFLNQILRVLTTLGPHELLALCHDVEEQAHRERTVHWGPRTLDVDIIDIDGVRIETSELTVPHPRAAQRAFVLAPWSWLDPYAELNGIAVTELLAAAQDRSGVRRVDVQVETDVEADGGTA